MTRHNGIDQFKILATISVISLHVGMYEGFHNIEISTAIRLLGRWAVPFFFIASGFFMAKVENTDRACKPLRKTIILFAISTLAMIPLNAIEYEFSNCMKMLISSQLLLSGSHFHLWYLSSAIVGYASILTLEKINNKKISAAIAFATITAYCAESYFPAGIITTRHLSSIGLIYIGIVLRKKNFGGKAGIALCLIGITTQWIECHALNRTFGHSLLAPQFLIGTIPFAIGMFEISRNYTSTTHNILSKLGAKHSLFIYIFHPYALYATEEINRLFFESIDNFIKDLTIVPITFLITLSFSIAMQSIIPQIHQLLNGETPSDL